MRLILLYTLILGVTILSPLVFTSYTFAQAQSCPETKYERIYMNAAHKCKYKNKIEITHLWDGPRSCDYHMKYRRDKSPELWKNKKTITLYSQTHPITVWVELNRKEFKEKNRDYWIKKGEEYLRIVESEYKRCPGALEPVDEKQNNAVDGLKNNKKQAVKRNTDKPAEKNNDTKPVFNDRKKTLWDDLTSPTAN